MPPEDARPQPTQLERTSLLNWLTRLRRFEALRNAGDPGVVLSRRLNGAEYNYAVHDLTGVDIQPTREFPVDPANTAGFDNSGESLTMSPALFKKYLGAARHVAEHLVLTPQGIAFAPHPVMTDTDRDKYCVKRIVEFYERQPTDYADYFLAAWELERRKDDEFTVADCAKRHGISPRYLERVRAILATPAAVGPIQHLQGMWSGLPTSIDAVDEARRGCREMRDVVVRLRRRLEPQVDNLKAPEVHKGSQSFVLWKNRQYGREPSPR